MDIKDCAYKDINFYDNMISDMAKEQAKIYDDFVLDKLSQLGYTLDYLENQDCYKVVKTINAYTEEQYFHANGVCVLGIKQTTKFESEGNLYKLNVELEVIGR